MSERVAMATALDTIPTVTSPTLNDLPEGTHSVTQVTNRTAQAVAQAFGEPVWVAGIVADKRPGLARGNWLRFALTDIDDTGKIVTKMPVVANPRIVAQIGAACTAARIRIADGVPLRIKAKVAYVSLFGVVQLDIIAIDATFTVGRLTVDKEVVIAELRAAGVFAAQQRLDVPAVPLKVAVVTASSSAAYADISNHLVNAGFAFEVVCFDTPVQGMMAPRDIAAAIARTTTHFPKWRPDIVIVARGGGARTDLAAFDDPLVARAIASCNVTVFTGIGHDIDSAVADLAAAQHFKTPTAAAQAVIDLVETAVARTALTASRIDTAATGSLVRAAGRCDDRSVRIMVSANARLQRADDAVAGVLEPVVARLSSHLELADASLGARGGRAVMLGERSMEAAERALVSASSLIAASDPARMLARGWSLTRTTAGAVVRDPSEAPAGASLVTTTAGGTVTSTVDTPPADIATVTKTVTKAAPKTGRVRAAKAKAQ